MQPEIVTLGARPYAFIAHTVPLAHVGAAAEPGFATVAAFLDGRKTIATGAPFVRYRRIDMAGTLDIEAGITVAQVGTGHAEVRFHILPAGRYGRLCWTGPYDELLAANSALIAWARRMTSRGQ